MVFTKGLSTSLLCWPKMTTLLEQVLKAYAKPEKVKIKNVNETNNLLTKIISAGPESLQVITDFDATLTRSHFQGKPCDSSYGVIANSPLMSAKMKEDAWDLFHKYYPIEVDVSMSAEEKSPHMEEWYEKCHDVFVKSNPPINHSQITEMVRDSHSALRENTAEFLEALNKLQIPTLILSAGMGEILYETLKLNGVYFPNLKVIANFMEFNENGELKGFSRPIVHTHNKNEITLHNAHNSYFENLKEKTHVLLLGDNLGDTNMAMGVKNPSAILKIGFLNKHIEEHLPTFIDHYDIVLLDDQTMDFMNSIIKLFDHESLNNKSN